MAAAEQLFRVKMYGGEFGIESSVIAIVGYLVVSLVAVWMIRRGRE